ncbi:chorion transcription factor Cf2-like [Scylla paramamosain]|uniref:chorion transcription factor Cf2-like n=1 Tax=Scylla paramamosain TaxID=85552 RepID=UPI0030828343
MSTSTFTQERSHSPAPIAPTVLPIKTSSADTCESTQVEREAKYQWTDASRPEDRQGLGSTSKVHQCRHCAYHTPDSYKLKRHTLKHTGERPFLCPYCSYTTTRKEFLNEHINTHTGEKPFSCPHCPYSSSHKNILRRHVRRHTTEQLSCASCPFQAITEADLKSHMLMHVTKKQKV